VPILYGIVTVLGVVGNSLVIYVIVSKARMRTVTRGHQGCSWAGTLVDGVPHFFGLKFVQKLVHCCNWLLTETQCKIISVQQK